MEGVIVGQQLIFNKLGSFWMPFDAYKWNWNCSFTLFSVFISQLFKAVRRWGHLPKHGTLVEVWENWTFHKTYALMQISFFLLWIVDREAHTGVWSQWKVDLLELKCPALKTLMFCYQGLTLKNERMTLSRTLRRMYDQRLTAAYRPIWSPGLIELNLKSL